VVPVAQGAVSNPVPVALQRRTSPFGSHQMPPMAQAPGASMSTHAPAEQTSPTPQGLSVRPMPSASQMATSKLDAQLVLSGVHSWVGVNTHAPALHI
jgi:hypothetical protein